MSGNRFIWFLVNDLVLKPIYCHRRRYCSQEPAFVEPMLFLDEFGNAGWQLLSAMTDGSSTFTARDLLVNPLLDLG